MSACDNISRSSTRSRRWPLADVACQGLLIFAFALPCQVLEPRRVAAKSAARRMAALLGEPVGRTVGYRVKLETRVSNAWEVYV